VISWPTIIKLLGYTTIGISACLIFPLGVALYLGDSGAYPLFFSLLAGTLAGGGAIFLWRPEPHEITRKEGVLFVVLAWLTAVFIGALPYWFSPNFTGLTDAFFESMSGYTTTGATILTDIEGLPASLLFWRALTHWLGGMGIIVLGIAILPLLGAGGTALYRAEFSGARSEKLKPRIAETAMALWKIYAGFTLAEYVALRFAGMGPFDAVCHSFATMATGGFSTRAASIEAYGSPLIEYIIILFMLIAGINFTLHYRFLVKREIKVFFADSEGRAYLLIGLACTIAVTITLLLTLDRSLADSFRLAAFQVVSIMTTTGFSSTDFELWAPFAQFLLLGLMFVGGCTGSTAGGMKVSRIMLLRQVVAREFRRLTERRGVFSVWKDGRAVQESTISSLLNLVYLALIVNFSACLILTATGVDLLTTVAAVTASMFNIGPGFGDVGATDNYGHLPGLAKWTLSFCMLAGRLEFYTALVIFSRSFWRK